MLVSELRKVVNKYSSDEKDKIIVELYKRIPKYVKEDYNIDNFIINIQEKNNISKEKKEISIEQLEKEVEYFIMCANNNLYVAPNKVIPKSERSKWRFKVKKFYKDLITFKPDSPEGIKATDLLKSLYGVLSVGSAYLTFTTWETFRAVQISQGEFLEAIMKRKLMNGISDDSLKYCVDLLDIEYDPYDSDTSLLMAFISCLKTADSKYIAIEAIKNKLENKKEKLKELEKNRKNTYDCEDHINNFVECVCYIYFELSEIDNGIRFFHKEYIEKNKEIKEYILLNMLDMFELDDEWIKEYEKHKNIDYRESLRGKYKELKSKK